jgi:hypothetical protein
MEGFREIVHLNELLYNKKKKRTEYGKVYILQLKFER